MYFRPKIQRMPTTSKEASAKVSAYIASLPGWSQEICKKLRAILLSTSPELAEEWKWGPHYSSNGMVCGYGAFQKHVKLTFFNGAGMQDPQNLFNHCVDNEFSRSIKYTDVKELDEALLKAYILESIAVNKKGFKRTVADKTVVVPEALQKALDKEARAKAFFENLSYGYKKEFVEHIERAKQEKTKAERIAKAVAYCAEGKTLNDTYKKTAVK
jgi:hypothetical protein